MLTNRNRFTKWDWGWIALVYAVGSMVIGILYYDSFVLTIVGLPAIYGLIILRRKHCTQKKIKQIREEFKLFMESMASALNAGYALENVFEIIRQDLLLVDKSSVLAVECEKMQRKIEMKQAVEKILVELGEETTVSEIQEFAQVIVIAKRSGGNMIQIIRDTCQQMDQSLQVEQEIEVMVAAKKMEQTIMLLVPFGMIFYLRVSNPGYLDCLYQTVIGHIVMTVCLIMIGISYWWSKKIIDIQI